MVIDTYVQIGIMILAAITLFVTVKLAVKSGNKAAINEAILKAVTETQQYDKLKSEVDVLSTRVNGIYDINGKELKEIKELIKDLSKRIDNHIDHS